MSAEYIQNSSILLSCYKKYSLKDLQYWDKYVRIQNCDKF